MPNLPKHAEEVYRKAYDDAVKQYEKPGNRRRRVCLDEAAHKIAWAAIMREYVIDYHTGEWKRKTRSESWPYS